MLTRTRALESAKQAVKTAVAGLVSLYVTYLFHLPQGYWAAISALIVMQSNVGATLAASRTRLAGTAVGALVGGIFVALFGTNMLAFALAVAISFFVCDSLRLAESQRLATVTVAIIMLIPSTASAWVIALHRFSEVALGIIIALLISLTLWPNHARRSVRRGLADTLEKISELYRAVMRSYLSQKDVGQPDAGQPDAGQRDVPVETLKASVSAAIGKNSDLLKNALQEAFGPLKERETLALLVNQVERIFHAVETLEFAVRDSASDTYFQNFQRGLEQLRDGIAAALKTLSEGMAVGKIGREWPDLVAIIGSIDQQAAEARKGGVTISYPLDEILRFYFLLLTSRNLIDELESVRALTAARLESK
jgi:uncharacterized membrane protein YccC